jgi:L-alanine-DL-glutamate epimerase-like enolase superfamily enzyme
LRYARKLSEYDVYFLEEPLAVDDPVGYSRLVKNSPLPISGGETLNSAALFRQHIDAEAFDIIQPDATVMGGIGECFEALTYAKNRGRTGVCHAFGAAVCQAANAHAAFAAGSSLFEWAVPPNPLRDELLIETWKIVDGKLQKPKLAGLGIELTGETEEKYKFVPGTNNPGNFR